MKKVFLLFRLGKLEKVGLHSKGRAIEEVQLDVVQELQAETIEGKSEPPPSALVKAFLVDEPLTFKELGNQHGYVCPQCGNGNRLKIAATRRVTVSLFPDGTNDDGGDTEWEEDDWAGCDCNWQGTVKALISIEVQD